MIGFSQPIRNKGFLSQTDLFYQHLGPVFAKPAMFSLSAVLASCSVGNWF